MSLVLTLPRVERLANLFIIVIDLTYLLNSRHVFVYELNATRVRHKKIKDIMLPNPAQWMAVFNERLCAGYVSGFSLFSIQGNGSPVRKYLAPVDLCFFPTYTNRVCTNKL